MNHEVTDRSSRKVEAEGLPVVAVVERNVDGLFRTGEQQSFALRIFADGVDGLVFRDSVHDLLPGLASVVGPVNMRMQIVKPEPVDRCVNSAGIEVRSVQLDDLLQEVGSPGETFCQVFPPSCVTWMS